ncbi:hypothetical protein [Halonatronum saccharophilum]|uniref:hypothetical protein n=1 Tax=Halonatronum saccharophilum TaxID=150060 RepID=UPI000483E140|nr:hypothetical protein [Halonatronum saccharophilum]
MGEPQTHLDYIEQVYDYECEHGEVEIELNNTEVTITIPMIIEFTFDGRANGFEFTEAKAEYEFDVEFTKELDNDDVDLIKCEVDAEELACSISEWDFDGDTKELKVDGSVSGNIKCVIAVPELIEVQECVVDPD